MFAFDEVRWPNYIGGEADQKCGCSRASADPTGSYETGIPFRVGPN